MCQNEGTHSCPGRRKRRQPRRARSPCAGWLCVGRGARQWENCGVAPPPRAVERRSILRRAKLRPRPAGPPGTGPGVTQRSATACAAGGATPCRPDPATACTHTPRGTAPSKWPRRRADPGLRARSGACRRTATGAARRMRRRRDIDCPLGSGSFRQFGCSHAERTARARTVGGGHGGGLSGCDGCRRARTTAAAASRTKTRYDRACMTAS